MARLDTRVISLIALSTVLIVAFQNCAQQKSDSESSTLSQASSAPTGKWNLDSYVSNISAIVAVAKLSNFPVRCQIAFSNKPILKDQDAAIILNIHEDGRVDGNGPSLLVNKQLRIFDPAQMPAAGEELTRSFEIDLNSPKSTFAIFNLGLTFGGTADDEFAMNSANVTGSYGLNYMASRCSAGTLLLSGRP